MLWPCEKGEAAGPPMAAATATPPVMIARISMRRPAHIGPQNPVTVLAPASGGFSARAAVSRTPMPAGIPTGHACGHFTAAIRAQSPARIPGSSPGAGLVSPPSLRAGGIWLGQGLSLVSDAELYVNDVIAGPCERIPQAICGLPHRAVPSRLARMVKRVSCLALPDLTVRKERERPGAGLLVLWPLAQYLKRGLQRAPMTRDHI